MPKHRSVIALFCLVFIALNFYRASQEYWDHGDPMDFRGLYVQTQLYWEGQDIYNDSVAGEKWDELKEKETFTSATNLGDKFYSIMLYPPQTPIILGWTKGFSWSQMRIIWWILCSASFFIILLELYRYQQDFLLILLAFGSKSSFFALALGQPFLPVLALVLIGIRIHEKAPIIAGLLFAFGMFKFNILVPVLAWLFFRRKFRTLIAMALSFCLLLLPVLLSHEGILPIFVGKVAEYYQFIYSPHPMNIYTFSDSELSMFIDYFYNREASFWNLLNTISLGLGFLLGGILYLRHKISSVYLLCLFILLSFLFNYHLSYDALMFLLPIAILPISSKAYKWSIALFLIFSLPINSVFGTGSIWSFHYPVLILIAALSLIFATDKKNFGIPGFNTPS